MRQLSLKGPGEGRGTFRHVMQLGKGQEKVEERSDMRCSLGKAWLEEWKERALYS